MDVCPDTSYVFAAGYPFATTADYAATFQQLDDLAGLWHLKLFHLNDSAKPLGSRRPVRWHRARRNRGRTHSAGW